MSVTISVCICVVGREVVHGEMEVVEAIEVGQVEAEEATVAKEVCEILNTPKYRFGNN